MLTIYRAFSGFLIAAVVGIVIGTMAARNKLARWFFDPLVSIGFPAPKIAFMPLFVLWFGLGDQAKITMVALSCIFPIISATYLGTGSIDRYLIWSARNLGVSRRRVVWKIVVPAALPQILSGLQIAFPMSLVVTVVTEMITAGGGLGGYMIMSARMALSEQVFVGILTIAIVGYVLLAARRPSAPLSACAGIRRACRGCDHRVLGRAVLPRGKCGGVPGKTVKPLAPRQGALR